jgi:hypothetical protein
MLGVSISLSTAEIARGQRQSILSFDGTATYDTMEFGFGTITAATFSTGYSFTIGYPAYGLQIDVVQANVMFGHHYTLDVAGPNHTLPSVGTYSNAERYGFQGNNPGLDFSGDGSGPNTVEGQFQVLEISSNSLAIDFLQHDGDFPQYFTEGSIRVNSDIPITVPEPSTLALLGLVALLFLIFSKRPGAVPI